MIPPLVDVIIPSYNYADKVGRAIDSVMKQTVSNFACYIIDDGSTDNTEEVVKELIKHDSRFHYKKYSNGGVSTARNRGIGLGTAPLICCLDADDAIEPLFLEACVMALQNKEYSIAYTGLKYILPNGKIGESAWPGEFHYDLQLQGNNQIPTCCVFRRIMWERLGGYRSRYCPHGAGSEDAEFWLRAGAHGFNAIKATDAPLFVYSFLTGRVSGDKAYTEINWLNTHPWTSDPKHPFPSMATPKKFSHPVHQYDNPVISVIIPVGPKHRETVFDALDSLEGQSFRDWEAIVVDDSGKSDEIEFNGFKNPWQAYPYVKRFSTEGGKGAGYARNVGASHARAPLLLFLDADDSLTSDCLEEMAIAWSITNQIVYSDYAGKAYFDEKEIDTHRDRMLFYDTQTKLGVMKHNSAEFDCERAVAEPTQDLYIWNLITSLVPKAWHDEIGGFDEKMSAWEDWDYWIRMAQAGKCFYHIRKPLVVYRFYTGTRRDRGLQDFESLIQYMIDKYRIANIMPCNCGSKSPPQPEVRREEINMVKSTTDSDFVLIFYDHPNRGQHKVVGVITQTNYGYRAGGDRFYVHKQDISAQPQYFKIVQEQIMTTPVVEVVRPIAPPVSTFPVDVKEEEEMVSTFIMDAKEIELDVVPGITPSIRAQLNAEGVHSLKELLEFGQEGLLTLKGIGKTRAATIYDFASDYYEKHKDD